MSDSRALLKSATAKHHEAVDHALGAMLNGTVDGYLRMLGTHANVLIPLEKTLDDAGAEQLIGDWPSRRRTAALLEDLNDFGISPPTRKAMSFDSDRGSLAGIIYVLEGSRLGSRLILKSVLEIASEKALPVRFLSHGAGDRYWASFLNWLQLSNLSDEEIASAIRAARRVFLAYTAAADADLERPVANVQ